MKKRILLIPFLIMLSIYVFADYELTRGPNIGEVYFIGPTTTGRAIYHSTDFGETVTCMDSTLYTNINFFSITADLTLGVLYGQTISEALFISYNYGIQDSWLHRNNNISYIINSGVNEGFIYSDIMKHSEDFGNNFVQHECNGFTGNGISTEIDNQQNVCYANISHTGINDSLSLYISYDKYENMELQSTFNINEMPIADLSRGTEFGELYNFADSPRKIYHSSDYGLTWTQTSQMGGGLDYKDLVGGRQAGEVYILATYDALMHTIDHSYIFHSTDYGRTFEVFHTFAKGQEPLVTNFSTSATEGITPFTVQFSNYSVGEILSYEWDFDNDGIADSNEIEPEYTYQDTGYYTVKLTIYSSDDSDDLIREDFIHVTDESGSGNYDFDPATAGYELSNYPNPFILSGAPSKAGRGGCSPNTTICFTTESTESTEIEIFNVKGQKIKKLSPSLCHPEFIEGRGEKSYQVLWNGTDSNGKPVPSGIYFYKLNIESSPVNKMLLLK